jgi:hypothetical protein
MKIAAYKVRRPGVVRAVNDHAERRDQFNTILQHHAAVKIVLKRYQDSSDCMVGERNSRLPCYLPLQTRYFLPTFTTLSALLRTELVSNSTVSSANPISRSFGHPYKRKITHYTVHQFLRQKYQADTPSFTLRLLYPRGGLYCIQYSSCAEENKKTACEELTHCAYSKI